jgi:hypothetical protein
MLIKTSELKGSALDYAVAKSEGKLDVYGEVSFIGTHGWCYEGCEAMRYIPSIKWAQGGPIIEREKISVAFVGKTLPDAMAPHDSCTSAHIDGAFTYYADTALIAAMRCYVASKLGDSVDVPDELI